MAKSPGSPVDDDTFFLPVGLPTRWCAADQLATATFIFRRIVVLDDENAGVPLARAFRSCGR